ncbi:MAG: type II toxin-antitoxin system VapC family toxin [Myxococcales bacterium]|nr:type II toxin-antitoxin system VapC family toxin [Myxococcales bacterium]
MRWLLDTNILSELRKKGRCDRRVAEWFAPIPSDDLHTSVLVVGEIRRGIESLRRSDVAGAAAIERWLHGTVLQYHDRILPIDQAVAEVWGRMNALRSLPVVDSLLAATAHAHGLILVTRNVRDLRAVGVEVRNPFDPAISD